jgi:hypothetical protein
VEVFYRIKFIEGKYEKDDDIEISIYEGWKHFEKKYFKIIEKFRRKIKMESEKYEIVRSEDEIEVKFERHEVNSDESSEEFNESDRGSGESEENEVLE